MTSINLIIFLKSFSPNIVILGCKVSIYRFELWGHNSIQTTCACNIYLKNKIALKGKHASFSFSFLSIYCARCMVNLATIVGTQARVTKLKMYFDV